MYEAVERSWLANLTETIAMQILSFSGFSQKTKDIATQRWSEGVKNRSLFWPQEPWKYHVSEKSPVLRLPIKWFHFYDISSIDKFIGREDKEKNEDYRIVFWDDGLFR